MLNFLVAALFQSGLLFPPTACPPPGLGEAKLLCRMQQCERVDSLFLFEFDGVVFNRVQAAPKQAGQRFEFTLKLDGPRFYYVGMGGNNVQPIILAPGEEVVFESNCNKIRLGRVVASPLNAAYQQLKQEMNRLKGERNRLLRSYQLNRRNPALLEQLVEQMAANDRAQLHLLDSLQRTQPYLAKIAALNTYLSYFNHPEGYDNEIDYFLNEYFRFAQWDDPDYAYLAWVFEGVKAYAGALFNIGFTDERRRQELEKLLARMPQGSRTHQLALGGVLAALQQKNSPLYLPFGEQFVELFGERAPAGARVVREQMQRLAAFQIGAPAPDFTLPAPDGTPLRLSDLRGKFVLVDFWASWCGPCRRENPNVVRLYERFHDKGFEILGVSLDKRREPWLQAIEKDRLTWKHVSDLKGWENEAARLYGVRSIPHTVLLDPEGRILARNLRGPALEAKLEEIFNR